MLPVQVVEDGIAWTRGAFQSASIEHRQLAFSVANKAGLLKTAGGFSHARAAYTQHVRKKPMRHAERSFLGAILRHQHPTREASVQKVGPVAGGALRHLAGQDKQVAIQTSPKRG